MLAVFDHVCLLSWQAEPPSLTRAYLWQRVRCCCISRISLVFQQIIEDQLVNLAENTIGVAIARVDTVLDLDKAFPFLTHYF